MAAQDFNVFSVVFDPTFDNNHPGTELNGTMGYQLHAGNVTQTLLANNPNNDGTIEAILYYPNPSTSSACGASTSSLIPHNLTTNSLAPPGGIPAMGLAPWTTPECVQAYLAQMRMDGVVGAVFYHHSNLTSTPPPVSDPSWDLHDGGKWRSDKTNFPVYALPGLVGANLMTELARYSGNISQVPYGNELSQEFDRNDIVRLLVKMDVNYTTGIPSLWIFLIIVLAILFSVVLATSIVMHLIQRKQRRNLQRRVNNGEVDLEALGIKQLRVSQDILDTMPQYTYTSKSETVAGQNNKKSATREVQFSQPTCPICLDDFEHGVTTIRELHCNHIFHPECIDPFLRDNSSLCPMCKKSALPTGYCPVQVTNLMVRRERLIRRMRQRATADRMRQSGLPVSEGRFSTAFAGVQRRMRRLSTANAYFGDHDTNEPTNRNATNTEMPTRTANSSRIEDMPPEIQSQGISARRAWRRERIARQQAADYSAHASEAREADIARPLWRRVIGRVIPILE